MERYYFDHNATSPILPQVKNAVLEAMDEISNPSSVHWFGRRARARIDDARKKLLEIVNAKDMRAIFTSSGTEANNMALRGITKGNILVSAIEHASVIKLSTEDSYIAVDKNGIVDKNSLEDILAKNKDKKFIISVMLANNEVGVIQPIAQITEIAKKYGALVHSDAVQALGKINLDVLDLGVDMLTISGHKFGAPQGVGAILFKKNIELNPLMIGGGQEWGFRAGTENVAAIYGLSVALDNLASKSQISNIEKLRNYLEERVKLISPQAKIFASKVARLPNTSCITMPNVNSQTQLIEFDTKGFAVSSGSACSSGKVTISHVLNAMDVVKEDSSCAIRISLGRENTKQQIDEFISVWDNLYKRVGANI